VCRLFAIAASSAFDPLLWLDALRRAAEHDPFLEKLGREPRHGDGWGVAALAADRILYYKSATPIWTDPLLESVAAAISFPAAVVAHARKASAGMPLGVGAAHPYALSLSDGSALFVAQNGGVDVEALARLLGRSLPPGNVDTFVYSLALSSHLEQYGELRDALTELHAQLERMGAVRGMANTAVLLVRRLGAGWTAEVGVVRHVTDPALREYGEIYVVEREGFVAASSITLRRTLREELWMEPVGENAVLTARPGYPKFERSAL